MERLTRRHVDGELFRPVYVIDGRKGYVNETDIIDKLAEYEDLEEQNRLIKLPCAVGDMIYVIDTDERLSNKEIKIYDIDNIVITSDGTILLKYDAHDGVICELENIVTDKPYLDFCRCFLTRAEAEAALKEL